jgi:hypothetical protein
MLRTAIGVLAGYITITVLVYASQTLVVVLSGRSQTVAFVNLLFALPYAALGGYIAAFISRSREKAASIALGVVAVGMAILSYLVGISMQPVWYWCTLFVLLGAGAYYGGFIRRRQMLP